MSRKMVLVSETMLLELKGKLPKSPDFQATIGLGQQLDQIQNREDLTLYIILSFQLISQLLLTMYDSVDNKRAIIFIKKIDIMT